MSEDDTTWWGGEKPAESVAEAAQRAGYSPTEAALIEQTRNALGPLAEADRQQRAEDDTNWWGGDKQPESVAEAAQRAGYSPAEAAQMQQVRDALAPLAEADRQQRAEAADGDSPATLGDPWGDVVAKLDDESFEDRAPEDLYPGFTLPDDGSSPNPADMDKGFTPRPRAQLTFAEDEGATITAGSSDSGMADSGFDTGFSGSALPAAGFSASSLSAAGFSASGVSDSESDSGFSDAGFSDAGFSDSEVSDSGSDGSLDDTGFFDE